MVMFNDDTEDLEHRPHRLILPGQDVKQRIALLFGGATLQNGLHVPLSVMNRPGEIERGRDNQAVQIDTTTLAFGNPESNGPGAIALGGRGIGLARTAKVTTAELDVLRLNRPLSNCHHTSPSIGFCSGASIVRFGTDPQNQATMICDDAVLQSSIPTNAIFHGPSHDRSRHFQITTFTSLPGTTMTFRTGFSPT